MRNGETVCTYEHYFDPLSDGTAVMLKKIASQDRLKLIMRNNRTGDVTGFWEFSNNFGLADVSSAFYGSQQCDDYATFDQRVEEAKTRYTTDELMVLALQ